MTVFAKSLEARCWVENEDVVGAAPTGDAPTTTEWSTILFPTRMRLILETLWYLSSLHHTPTLSRFPCRSPSHSHTLSGGSPFSHIAQWHKFGCYFLGQNIHPDNFECFNWGGLDLSIYTGIFEIQMNGHTRQGTIKPSQQMFFQWGEISFKHSSTISLFS